MKEFLAAIQDLKNADPQDFHAFLQAAHILYPLHNGQVGRALTPVTLTTTTLILTTYFIRSPYTRHSPLIIHPSCHNTHLSRS